MTFRIDPGRPFDEEIRRIVSEEAGAAKSILSGTGNGRHRELHDARKRLKRVRAILRLVRSGDAAFAKRENGRYRDIARSLSEARDAGALVETVDRFLIEHHGTPVAGHLGSIRGALVRRRDRIVRHAAGGLDRTVAEAVASLDDGIAALDGLTLPHEAHAAAAVLSAGVRTNMRYTLKSMRRARKRRHVEDFHDLRKAVKDHWMHLGLVRGLWPGPLRKRRSAMDALGETMGELNDLSVMTELLAAESARIATKEQLDTFRDLIRRKEKALRRDCLAETARLFPDKPTRVAAGLERSYREAATKRAGERVDLRAVTTA